MSPRRLVLACLVAIAFACPVAAAADDVIVEVSVGWGGRFRPDRWTPAVVRAQSRQPRPVLFRWYVPRPGREAMLIEQSVTLNPQTGDHFAYLPIGPDPAAIHLTVSDAQTGRTLAYWPTEVVSPIAYAETQVRQPNFIGVSGVGPALGWLDREAYEVSYLPPEHLPRRAIGYEGLDLLVLNRPQIVDLSMETQHAIAAWVRGGGRLLLWLDIQALPDDSPLLGLVPGGGVADFQTRTIAEQAVGYTQLREVLEDQLVTRAAVGLGEIIFLHVPPDAAVAAGASFLPTAPRLDPVPMPELPPEEVSVAAKVADSSRSLPIALLAVAVLIGPVDWLVLHRTQRRMRRWWITLPGWLAMFGLLIWYLPTQPTPHTSAVVTTQPDEIALVGKASLATTGGDLSGGGSEEVARMHSIGPVYWRTVGFERTSGPLRDLVLMQGRDGMSLSANAPALAAEGTVFAE
jgi:hypothetical protein